MRIGSTLTASIVVVICVAVGIAGYLMLRANTPEPPQFERQLQVIGKFTPVSPALPAPAQPYLGRDGAEKHLGDRRGHWVLLNLWATWCAPCVKEMPSLDRLQAALGTALDVVAISEDRNGAKVVDSFLADKVTVKSLTVGLDPKGKITGALHVEGLPTSFLIDPNGRIVAKLEGATVWDEGPTLARLKQLMAAPQ